MRGRTARRVSAEAWMRRERKARPDGKMPVFWVRSEYRRYWKLHGPRKAPGLRERQRIWERQVRGYWEYSRLVSGLVDSGFASAEEAFLR